MLTLVVYFCLLSSDNGCEIVAVADKFPTMEMCAELGNKFIVPQWASQHPEVEIRRWTCTPTPEFILHRNRV